MPTLKLRRAAVLCAGAVLFVLVLSGCRLFVPYYTLSLSVDGDAGGSISAEPEQADYRENTLVELTADADPGWVFDSWTGVSSENGADATVVMDMTRKVTAVFKVDLKTSNPSDNLINAPLVGFSPEPEDTWTFMVYLDADNNLEPYSLLDFNEMEEGLDSSGNSNINIIVLYDRYDGGASDSDWSGTRLYKVVANSGSEISSTPLYPGSGIFTMTAENDIELNMGDPAVLSEFMQYCRAEHTADHYALFLWNHGGGARSSMPLDVLSPSEAVLSREICQDEDTGSGSGTDYLFLDELQQAVASAVSAAPFEDGIDLIGIDACLMGTVEAAYELRNLTEYYVASMADEHVGGWDYNNLFSRMTSGAGASDAGNLAKLMVDSFRETAPPSPVPTLSAVRTTYLSDLKAALDNLATALYSSGKKPVIESIRDRAVNFFTEDYEPEAVARPYHDLNDLCSIIINNEVFLSAQAAAAAEAVTDELARTVVSAYAGEGLGGYYAGGAEVKRGLSIFFSQGELQYANASHYASQYWYTEQDCSDIGPYGNIDFCTSDTDGIVESWRELHEVWYDPYAGGGYTPGSW